jgi:hypothetical protein
MDLMLPYRRGMNLSLGQQDSGYSATVQIVSETKYSYSQAN